MAAPEAAPAVASAVAPPKAAPGAAAPAVARAAAIEAPPAVPCQLNQLCEQLHQQFSAAPVDAPAVAPAAAPAPAQATQQTAKAPLPAPKAKAPMPAPRDKKDTLTVSLGGSSSSTSDSDEDAGPAEIAPGARSALPTTEQLLSDQALPASPLMPEGEQASLPALRLRAEKLNCVDKARKKSPIGNIQADSPKELRRPDEKAPHKKSLNKNTRADSPKKLRRWKRMRTRFERSAEPSRSPSPWHTRPGSGGTKTKMCNRWQTGKCGRGQHCTFAHEKADFHTPIPEIPRGGKFRERFGSVGSVQRSASSHTRSVDSAVESV